MSFTLRRQTGVNLTQKPTNPFEGYGLPVTDELAEAYDKLQVAIDKAYDDTLTDKKDKSKKDAQKEQEKKELEALKSSLEMRKKIIDKYKESVDLTDFGLDIAQENDFSLRVDLLNNKMTQLTSYGQAMRQEFDRASKIIPKTGEQAEALASHLETLGNDMRSNIKDMREARVAMEQLKIDSIVSSGDTYVDDLQRELDAIEKRIEYLKKDNKDDYEYTNKILNMSAFLPNKSDFAQSRQNRTNEDRDIINSQQETNDILTDMLKTQIEKNENLREEERQALLVGMDDIRQKTKISLSKAAC